MNTGLSHKSHGDSKWLSPRDLAEPEGMRLFCLPHAGSGASSFYRWRANFRGIAAICAFHLPGRESRLAEPAITQFDQLLENLLTEIRPHLDRPYILFGHSMGASLAFELARKLEEESLAGPVCLILSGRDAPNYETAGGCFAGLNDGEMVSALDKIYDGNLSEALSDPEMRSIYLSILRADLGIVDSYRFVNPYRKLHCPIEVFGGSIDASTTQNGLELWQNMTLSTSFYLTMFPGTHFYLLGNERQIFLDHLKRRCVDYGRLAR